MADIKDVGEDRPFISGKNYLIGDEAQLFQGFHKPLQIIKSSNVLAAIIPVKRSSVPLAHHHRFSRYPRTL
jgi:hypothetical protein